MYKQQSRKQWIFALENRHCSTIHNNNSLSWNYSKSWRTWETIKLKHWNCSVVLAFSVWMVRTSTWNIYQRKKQVERPCRNLICVGCQRGEVMMMVMEIAETDGEHKGWSDGKLADWAAELSEEASDSSWSWQFKCTLFHIQDMWSFHTSVWTFGSVLTADETAYFHLATP